jgi:hypothetical protein
LNAWSSEKIKITFGRPFVSSADERRGELQLTEASVTRDAK